MAKLTKAQQQALTQQQEVALGVVKDHMVELGISKDVVAEWTEFMKYKNDAIKYGKFAANAVVKVSIFTAALAALLNFIPWGAKP